MAFFTSLESVFSIVLLIALGYALRRKGWFADTFGANISRLIMNIALPASIFVSVLTYLTRDKLLSLSGGLAYGAVSVVIGYLAAFAMVSVLKVRAGRRGVFINTVVNANTIFIGLPLNTALLGQESLPYFLVYYVLNTVSTWAFGALLIARDSSEPRPGSRAAFNWKKLLPAPLIGFLVALVFLLADIPVPPFVHGTLSYLGGTVTPLSLIYIGIVLADAGLGSIRFDKDTVGALAGRFILMPAVTVALILLGRSAAPLPDMEAQTLFIQSAVPALAVLPILANEARGDTAYATNIVTTSTILFLAIVPLADWLMRFV